MVFFQKSAKVRVMSKELTEIQRNILDYIVECRTGRGIPPTLADIAARFGYKNRSTVQQHITALERKGYLKRNPGLSRSIELTLTDKMFIPRPILGEVAAGNPITIYPDAIDIAELPSIIRMPEGTFLLRVRGDSLKDAYIFSGDIVIVNSELAPLNGHIVVAVLDDGAIVKRFFKRPDAVELHSENPEYQPIIVSAGYAGFRIVGVVVGMYRMMERRVG